MLNPSTADQYINDPTVQRCMNFARKWGYGALNVLNLFAYRSTDPSLLYTESDPVGPENKHWFHEVLPSSGIVVCAWGTHGKFQNQDLTALEWLKNMGITPMALRVTKNGFPAHPLYLPSKLIPIAYSGR